MRHYFQSKPYREFVKTQTCTFRILGHLDCEGVTDPQHDPVKAKGSDLDCIPLCRKHHDLHKTKPLYYRQVIDQTVLISTKRQMLEGFFRFLGLDTEEPTVKVKQRKKPEVVKTSKFQEPLKPNSRKRKESKLRPYDWRLNMQSEVCNEVPDA